MLRRKESLGTRLHRYRGVLAVVAVPLVLVLLIALLMPRASILGGSKGSTVSITEQAEGQSTNIAASAGSEYFSIIFDAGSTGSRVHIFRFAEDGGEMVLKEDTFEQLKPGLSAFPDNPQEAAASLKPLLDKALQIVPKAMQGKTKVKLGATAGLRLLPGGKADSILAAVKKYLQASPFLMDDKTGVTVLDGSDEGAFAWLTLNYLLGKLGQQPGDTVAAIDLGGGSVQQAFALTPEEAKTAPKGFVMQLAGGPKEYHVYVHSYLGFGLMAGRAAVLAWEETRAANPCVPTDHKGTYEYGGTTYELTPHQSGPSFDQCAKVVHLVLKLDMECGAPHEQCSFNGVWGGGSRHPTAFYVSSYFWDRATEAGIISDPKAVTWEMKIKDVRTAGDKACTSKLSAMQTLFPLVEDKQAPFLCLDLSFQYTMLKEGFHLPEDTSFTLVKKVKYRNQEFEAAWPLGAAINLMSAAIA